MIDTKPQSVRTSSRQLLLRWFGIAALIVGGALYLWFQAGGAYNARHNNDFKHIYAGAWLLARGESPYDPKNLFMAAEETMVPPEQRGLQKITLNPYVYFPFTGLVMAPVAALSFDAASTAWFAINHICLLLALAVLIGALRFESRWAGAGLAALLPAALTILILAYVFILLGKPVHYIGEKLRQYFQWKPDETKTLHQLYWWMYAIDVFVTISVIYLVGRFLVLRVGKRVFRRLEGAFARMPFVKNIYPHVRQLADFIFSKPKVDARQAVAIPYPHQDVYAIGFVTGPALTPVCERVGADMVNVFVPTSPTPFTGYVIMVPHKDVVYLQITTEEAFRLVVSGGVLVPPGRTIEIEFSRPPSAPAHASGGGGR